MNAQLDLQRGAPLQLSDGPQGGDRNQNTDAGRHGAGRQGAVVDWPAACSVLT